jgi:ubiquinone/menaquinone biosynthesis C-methylase UbiE
MLLSLHLPWESKWRTALLLQLNPRESDVIADVGCGTASFLILLGRQVKRARLIGIDPDGDILKRARSNLTGAAISVELHRGYLREVGTILSGVGVNEIVSVSSSIKFRLLRSGRD